MIAWDPVPIPIVEDAVAIFVLEHVANSIVVAIFLVGVRSEWRVIIAVRERAARAGVVAVHTGPVTVVRNSVAVVVRIAGVPKAIAIREHPVGVFLIRVGD